MRTYLLCLFLLLFHAGSVLAREDSGWHLQADRLQADSEKKCIEGFGEVTLRQQDNLLRADYIRYFPKTHSILLRGNVQAIWGKNTFSAQEANFDLEKQTGWFHQGSIFMAEPHVYLTAEQMEKTGTDTYTFQEASVTGCDDKSPAWSLRTNKGELTLDGYTWLYGPRFQIKGHSVFYSPFFVFPIRKNRQSGLLQPQITQNNRLGFIFNQPLYLALNEENDLTFYENFISKRGLMQGLEYRHTNNPSTLGIWRLDWLYDRQTAPRENDEDSLFRGDGLVRPNQNRYWLRSKLNTEVQGWDIKLDLDVVSDQNYLREFKKGLSGFSASETMFRDKFGRGLEPNDSLLRPSTLLLGKNFSGQDLFIKTQFQQNLAYINNNLPASHNPALQRLPEIYFYQRPMALADTSLNWDFMAESGYYWRRYGQSNIRLDLFPRLMHTLHTPVCSLTTQTGWIYSGFWDTETAILSSKGTFTGETILTQSLFRIYPHPEKQLQQKVHRTNTRHTIIPKLSYLFVQDSGQQHLALSNNKPEFAPRHELRYSLKNILTGKTTDSALPGQSSTQLPYHDFFICNLEQSYDIREARREKEKVRYQRRPFSDMLAELRISPQQYIELYSKTWFSFYDGRVNEHEHGLRLFSAPSGELSLGLDFLHAIDEYKRRREKDLEILRISCQADFFLPWRFAASIRSDMKARETIEKKIMLSYQHQCFSLDFIHEYTDYENRFEIRFKLGTLGGTSYAY